MKDDSLYREGRVSLGDDGKALLDHREARAIRKKTRKGREMSVTSWIEYEFQTMQLLYGFGANVPRPVTQVGNAVLMEYIGEATNPAPILYSVALGREEARDLFEILMRNVEVMLANHRIHADLSAYNVLYWEGQVTIIDFPQVVDPILNPKGYALLARDVHRLCQYFHRYGIRANASQIATDLWGRYLRGELETRM
jgi:RIO kinase 1